MTGVVIGSDGRVKDRTGIAPQGVVFSAYPTAAISSNGGYVKVTFGAKEFDPFGWFDTANSRFQPKVPGYYRISGVVSWNNVPDGRYAVLVAYKNGASYKNLDGGSSGAANPWWLSGSTIVYLNGSTDYVELYSYAGSAGYSTLTGLGSGEFSAELIATSVGVVPEPWRNVGAAGEPAFQNSWTNYNTAIFAQASFMKDPHGFVHLRGFIKNGASATVIFTLPAGYRPSPAVERFPSATNGLFGWGQVYSNGDVYCGAWQGSDFSLSGWTFRAEA